MVGSGPYVAMIGQRFRLACRKFGLDQPRRPARTDLFTRPPRRGDQLAFDLGA